MAALRTTCIVVYAAPESVLRERTANVAYALGLRVQFRAFAVICAHLELPDLYLFVNAN